MAAFEEDSPEDAPPSRSKPPAACGNAEGVTGMPPWSSLSLDQEKAALGSDDIFYCDKLAAARRDSSGNDQLGGRCFPQASSDPGIARQQNQTTHRREVRISF